MERESFEDEEVAEVLNQNFIAIKVDREERPDIDSIYMSVCQALTGSGGWPLTIIMTPDKKPFFAGTYFPKEGKYSRPGLMDILTGVKDAWSTRKDELVKSGSEIADYIHSSVKGGKGKVDVETAERAYDELKNLFDPIYGGFGSSPKFPTPHNLSFLMRYMEVSGHEESIEIVEKTLASMYKGGIFDHIGFGFSRYSTDKRWLVPHFEKMLYDNALLSIAFTETYQATGNILYKEVAEKVFKYVLRDMTSEDGGFYCAEDADSEGVEGKFYLWTRDEIVSILGDNDANVYCKYYDITDRGNFEGKNIPNLIGIKLDEIDDELKSRLESMRVKLYRVREERVHPYKDDKILTSWNGLMIAALAYGGRVFDNDGYIKAAVRASSFIFEKLMSEDGRLFARYRDGESMHKGYLDDYAFLIWGLIELYEATLDAAIIEKAVRLNSDMLELFWDEEHNGLFLYGNDSEMLIMRPKEVYDGAMPSGNSVAALNMLRLASMTGDTRLKDKAEILFDTFGGAVSSNPNSYTFFLMALLYGRTALKEIIIAGDRGSKDVNAILNEINNRYLPYSTLVLNDESEGIFSIHPSIEGYRRIDDKATVYICQNFACSKPVTDAAQLKEKLDIKQILF